MFQVFGNAGILLRTILNGSVTAHFDSILKPVSLITGFLTLICILAYIVEIKRPGKLNLKTLLLSISPFVIVSVLLVLSHPSPLHHPEEIIDGIKHPDVWLRLIIVFFYIAYPLVAICQPYNWRECLVSRKTVAGLQILSCLIAPAFIAGLACGYFPAVIFNFIIAIILDTLVVYIELKLRIPVTAPVQDYESEQEQEESVCMEQNSDSVFDSPEVWMNPDMTATELSRIMGTNHPYLLKKIKGLGYSSYSDMINRKRVEHICKEIEKGTDESIISLMFKAGFRSRSTASREFKRIVGCTPSEFQESISK